jgi:hypothetical protein
MSSRAYPNSITPKAEQRTTSRASSSVPSSIAARALGRARCSLPFLGAFGQMRLQQSGHQPVTLVEVVLSSTVAI